VLLIIAGLLAACSLGCAGYAYRKGLDVLIFAAGGLALGPVALLALGVVGSREFAEPTSFPEGELPPVSVVPSFVAPPLDKDRGQLIAELAGSAPVAVPGFPKQRELRKIAVNHEALPATQASAPTSASMIDCPHCNRSAYLDHFGLCALCAEPVLQLS
jgi:hypothetical protein